MCVHEEICMGMFATIFFQLQKTGNNVKKYKNCGIFIQWNITKQ